MHGCLNLGVKLDGGGGGEEAGAWTMAPGLGGVFGWKDGRVLSGSGVR